MTVPTDPARAAKGVEIDAFEANPIEFDGIGDAYPARAGQAIPTAGRDGRDRGGTGMSEMQWDDRLRKPVPVTQDDRWFQLTHALDAVRIDIDDVMTRADFDAFTEDEARRLINAAWSWRFLLPESFWLWFDAERTDTPDDDDPARSIFADWRRQAMPLALERLQRPKGAPGTPKPKKPKTLIERYRAACAVLVHPIGQVDDYCRTRFGAPFAELPVEIAQPFLDVEMRGWHERDDSPITPGVSIACRRSPWGCSFLRMFDMSMDSHLFGTKAELEAIGGRLTDGRFLTPTPGSELYCETAPGVWTRVAEVIAVEGVGWIKAVAGDDGRLRIGVLDVHGQEADQATVDRVAAAMTELAAPRAGEQLSLFGEAA